MSKMIKYIGAVAIGYGSIVFYSGVMGYQLPDILVTGFGAVVAITGTAMVVADYERGDED